MIRNLKKTFSAKKRSLRHFHEKERLDRADSEARLDKAVNWDRAVRVALRALGAKSARQGHPVLTASPGVLGRGASKAPQDRSARVALPERLDSKAREASGARAGNVVPQDQTGPQVY